MSYFNFEGNKVYYTEQGIGTPLLLLHGNAASSNMFYEISNKYAEDYNVILIDFLGHGKSDRLEEFPADLWYYEAEQVIAFLKEKKYQNVNIIGCSGGALVAINVALEAPEFVHKIIADSFEGERAIKPVTDYIKSEREDAKRDKDSQMFYYYMHGEDWENVVDNDTEAIIKHGREIGAFFHKALQTLHPEILLIGSREDEFVCQIDPNYFEVVYGEMINKIGHGRIYLFETGGHPAMLTNQDDFYKLSREFLSNK